jgi:hypothetical protein
MGQFVSILAVTLGMTVVADIIELFWWMCAIANAVNPTLSLWIYRQFLFYSICSVLFFSFLFCSLLLYSILFNSFCSTLFISPLLPEQFACHRTRSHSSHKAPVQMSTPRGTFQSLLLLEGVMFVMPASDYLLHD